MFALLCINFIYVAALRTLNTHLVHNNFKRWFIVRHCGYGLDLFYTLCIEVSARLGIKEVLEL